MVSMGMWLIIGWMSLIALTLIIFSLWAGRTDRLDNDQEGRTFLLDERDIKFPRDCEGD